MELEQLQNAWKELNERVQQNEWVHQQQIQEMLLRQKKSSIQGIQRVEQASLFMLIGITVVITAVATILPPNRHLITLHFWPFIVLVLGIGFTFTILSLQKLTQIQKEKSLEQQVRNMLQYKQLVCWAYLAGYLSTMLFLAYFLYKYSFFWPILFFVLIGIIVDYFIFHYITGRIKDFSQINKELAELKN